MQRKVLDHQAQNFLTMLESLKELSDKINGGRNDNLGKVVDVIAWKNNNRIVKKL